MRSLEQEKEFQFIHIVIVADCILETTVVIFFGRLSRRERQGRADGQTGPAKETPRFTFHFHYPQRFRGKKEF